MIVIMKNGASREHIEKVVARVESDGYSAHISEGEQRTIIGVVGEAPTPKREENFATMDGVEQVVRVSSKYKLAGRDMHPQDTLVPLNGAMMGGAKPLVIAGPCSVENREQIIEIAEVVKRAGATALRGGAYKPRSSPYSFQGHGEDGLKWLAEARDKTGLPVVTEVMEPELVPLVSDYADVLQIGARNMQNFALLKAVGNSKRAVLLKRGMSCTIEELLMAAEYILSQGNPNVMLCERGIRTFETETRNTFDINAVVALKQLTHLPVVADPSHAVGKWEYVEGVALGAIAAGADGLIVEVHPEPDKAYSDGRQSLKYDKFEAMMGRMEQVAAAVGRVE